MTLGIVIVIVFVPLPQTVQMVVEVSYPISGTAVPLAGTAAVMVTVAVSMPEEPMVSYSVVMYFVWTSLVGGRAVGNTVSVTTT